MACGVFLKRQAGSSDGTSLPMFCFFHALRRRQCSWGQSIARLGATVHLVMRHSVGGAGCD